MSSFLRARGGAMHSVIEMIVGDPDLVAAVRELTPDALSGVIDSVGLADSGPLISLLSPAQFTAALDHDLWHAELPGTEEEFDADRFMTWLEIMIEMGEKTVIDRLEALPEEMVVYAFHKCLTVLTEVELAMALKTGENSMLAEKAFSSSSFYEIGEFVLIPKQEAGLDAVMQALLALERHDHRFMHFILSRCADLSVGDLEESDGLHTLLTRAETLGLDIAGEREDRRTEAGFVAPQRAAAYLKFARIIPPDAVDTVRPDAAQAVFGPPNSRPGGDRIGQMRAVQRAQAQRRLAALVGIRNSGQKVAIGVQSALSGGDRVSRRRQPFRDGMRQLADEAPAAHQRCIDELAQAANIVVSGATLHGDRFGKADAVAAVTALCELGMEDSLTRQRIAAAVLLEARGVEPFLRQGLSMLHRQVFRLALERTRDFAAGAATRADDADTQQDLLDLVRQADAALRDDASGQVIDDLMVLHGLIEGPDITALEGLIQTIPVLSGTLSQVERFVASRADIEEVIRFLDRTLNGS